MIRETAGRQRRLLLASLVTLVLLAGLGVGWLFPPIYIFGGFSPWERLTGETPSAKVNAVIDAVSRGDEAAALALWERPTTPFPAGRTQALGARRLVVTRDLISAGVRPQVTIQSVEWWRTCCEPGIIANPSDAGGVRLHIQLVDRRGTTLNDVVDVFNRGGAYWGAAANDPTRHWVVRDVHRVTQPPIFWTWGER